MFRRRTSPETPTAPSAEAPGQLTDTGAAGSTRSASKGRPTPTRREAEAAARERAKVPRGRKEVAAAQRKARQDNASKARLAMRNGDEKHLLPRDQGPVRRFVRDFVDSRLAFLEVVLPVVLITTALTYSGQPALVRIGSSVMVAVLLLIVVDVLLLRLRLGRELTRRFPQESTKGTTWYAVSRSMQMRFMRLPKSKVKVGQQLPERYR